MIKSVLRAAICSVIRRLPIVSGRRKIAFNLPMNWLLKDLPNDVEVNLRDGTPIIVTPADDDGRIVYLFGVADIKVAVAATALIGRTDIFLDIGANYGTIGFEVARRLGADGAVHIFEPQANLVERIESAIRAGGKGNIYVHPIGLLDVDGKFELRRPQNHSGMGSFVTDKNQSVFNENEICQVRAISDYLPPLIKGRSFGIKLDVEGAEPTILPFLVALEGLQFMILESNANQEKIFNLLKSAGLTIFGFIRHPVKVMFEHVDHVEQVDKFSDLLALRVTNAPSKASLTDIKSLLGAQT